MAIHLNLNLIEFDIHFHFGKSFSHKLYIFSCSLSKIIAVRLTVKWVLTENKNAKHYQTEGIKKAVVFDQKQIFHLLFGSRLQRNYRYSHPSNSYVSVFIWCKTLLPNTTTTLLRKTFIREFNMLYVISSKCLAL